MQTGLGWDLNLGPPELQQIVLAMLHLNFNGYYMSGSPYSAVCKLDICGKM